MISLCDTLFVVFTCGAGSIFVGDFWGTILMALEGALFNSNVCFPVLVCDTNLGTVVMSPISCACWNEIVFVAFGREVTVPPLCTNFTGCSDFCTTIMWPCLFVMLVVRGMAVLFAGAMIRFITTCLGWTTDRLAVEVAIVFTVGLRGTGRPRDMLPRFSSWPCGLISLIVWPDVPP